MEGRIKILYKKCDSSLSKDKSLPLDSYLICYSDDGELCYDIVQGSKVGIFDHYYDEYRNVISMRWTDGRVNPRVYGVTTKKNKK